MLSEFDPNGRGANSPPTGYREAIVGPPAGPGGWPLDPRGLYPLGISREAVEAGYRWLWQNTQLAPTAADLSGVPASDPRWGEYQRGMAVRQAYNVVATGSASDPSSTVVWAWMTPEASSWRGPTHTPNASEIEVMKPVLQYHQWRWATDRGDAAGRILTVDGYESRTAASVKQWDRIEAGRAAGEAERAAAALAAAEAAAKAAREAAAPPVAVRAAINEVARAASEAARTGQVAAEVAAVASAAPAQSGLPVGRVVIMGLGAVAVWWLLRAAR